MRKSSTNYNIHMYVTKDGLFRLLADVKLGSAIGGGNVLVYGDASTNTMLSVWITQEQYDRLVTGDLKARYQ